MCGSTTSRSPISGCAPWARSRSGTCRARGRNLLGLRRPGRTPVLSRAARNHLNAEPSSSGDLDPLSGHRRAEHLDGDHTSIVKSRLSEAPESVPRRAGGRRIRDSGPSDFVLTVGAIKILVRDGVIRGCFVCGREVCSGEGIAYSAALRARWSAMGSISASVKVSPIRRWAWAKRSPDRRIVGWSIEATVNSTVAGSMPLSGLRGLPGQPY